MQISKIGSVLKNLSRSQAFWKLSAVSMSSNANKLNGKVAIVTASTDGIGLAVARRLGQDGAHVVISSRKQKNVDKAINDLKKEGLSVSGLVCHVANPEDRKALIDHTLSEKGGIDIFISNAAANPFMGNFFDTPEDAWDKVFDINVKSAFLLSREIIPHMAKRGGGSIVYISSIAGYVPSELLGAYSVSKTALLGLIKAAVPQCSEMNIRVNGVAPGIIKTRFSGPMWKDEGVADHIKQQIALRRIGEPSEMGGVVSFLCSDDASYITGETIVAAGGMVSKL
jgi:dehydrogenase/reductase SDR family protein 4